MKILLILILLVFPAFIYAQDDEIAKKRVDSIVDPIRDRIADSKKSFTIKKRKYTEKWTYSMNDGKIEYFSVEYFHRNTQYSQHYFLQNEQLIYVEENEEYYTGNGENQTLVTGWSGYYYFENRKLVHLMTNGHGKSETDDWQPEKETLKMFDSRWKTLKKKLKD